MQKEHNFTASVRSMKGGYVLQVSVSEQGVPPALQSLVLSGKWVPPTPVTGPVQFPDPGPAKWSTPARTGGKPRPGSGVPPPSQTGQGVLPLPLEDFIVTIEHLETKP